MTYTLIAFDPLLDLPPWQGQRQCTFRFNVTDQVGMNLGEITPLRGASLTHDTTRTIKRQLNLALGVTDTAAINPIQDRVSVTMVIGDQEWPLGRYLFTDASRQVYTSGKISTSTLNDEMFLVDQQISSGLNGYLKSTTSVILDVVEPLPITVEIEASPFVCAEAWSVGTHRGQILESLAVTGDYFSPWFDNLGILRFIRSFDPVTKIPDFDWDANKQVLRDAITESDDLLTAPNKFIVTSNSGTSDLPIFGVATVPPTAPHSAVNRGFEILETVNLQLSTISQAEAVAANLANRQTVFERTILSTPPDPRHDSYNVIRWQGDLWLELAWSMALTEGGEMNHSLRKAYPL
jgi:hypothetical protein